jgi:hypothetical protein
MKVHGIEPPDQLPAFSVKVKRPVQPPQHIRTAIMDLHAVKIYGTIIWNVAIMGTIYTGCKHMHIMPRYCETPTQSVN